MYYLSFALSYAVDFCSLYLESSQYNTSSAKALKYPRPPIVALNSLGRAQGQVSRPAIDRVEHGDLVAGDITLLRLARHRELEQGQPLAAGEALEEVPQLVAARHRDEPLRAGHAVARRVRRHPGAALRQLAAQGLLVAAVPGLEGVAVPAVEEADLAGHSLGGGVSGRMSASAPSLGSSGGMVGGGVICLRLVRGCRLLELLGMVESLKVLESLELFVGEIEGHAECFCRSEEGRGIRREENE